MAQNVSVGFSTFLGERVWLLLAPIAPLLTITSRASRFLWFMPPSVSMKGHASMCRFPDMFVVEVAKVVSHPVYEFFLSFPLILSRTLEMTSDYANKFINCRELKFYVCRSKTSVI